MDHSGVTQFIHQGEKFCNSTVYQDKVATPLTLHREVDFVADPCLVR